MRTRVTDPSEYTMLREREEAAEDSFVNESGMEWMCPRLQQMLESISEQDYSSRGVGCASRREAALREFYRGNDIGTPKVRMNNCQYVCARMVHKMGGERTDARATYYARASTCSMWIQ